VRRLLKQLLLSAVLACAIFLLPGMSWCQIRPALDTRVYKDSATAIIVELARARHQVQSLRLAGYRSKVFTRLEGHVGASRFGPGWTVFKYETAALVHWTRNGDLKVDVEGGRMTGTRMPGFGRDQMASFFEDIFGGEVWFIPSTVGDDIELMGLPDAEALHPLARGADRFYRYGITDSMRIAHSGRTVRVYNVSVAPRVTSAYVEIPSRRGAQGRDRRSARSLFSGRLWVDADSLDVVRLTGAFVGEHIWDEEDDAPQLQNLEADIEFALHEDRFWLPQRQVLTAHWTFKYLPGADLVGTGITTFSDFDVEVTESEIAFTHDTDRLRGQDNVTFYRGDRVTAQQFGNWQCPEAWEFDGEPSDPRCGTQATTSVGVNEDGSVWEVNLPTLDSLKSYDFDTDWNEAVDLASNESLDNAIREIAEIGTNSPAVNAFARKPGGVDWRHVYNAFGYNRVQGPSVGGGYQWSLWSAYTTLHLNARYGFNDKHLLGSATWRRDAPVGRFELTVYRAVQEVEPWTNGTGIGNSLKALALGNDDADYYLAPVGGGISFSSYTGWFADGEVSLQAERHESLANRSSSFIAGSFQPNLPIAGGDYLRATLSKTWHPGFSGTTQLTLAGQGLASRDSVTARFWGGTKLPFVTESVVASLRTRAGIMFGAQLPQMSYRIGGPETVRGYGYGVDIGRHFWSAQADIEWVVNQWWSPVLFADVGAIDFRGTPLVGAGAGLSLLSGWTRIDLSHGLTRDGRLRLDITLGIPTS